jgi:hypothetical protein
MMTWNAANGSARVVVLLIGVCFYASCLGPESAPTVNPEGCTRTTAIDGERFECSTKLAYARCVANLLERRVSWCRYTGTVQSLSGNIDGAFFDVRRATAGGEALVRERCPRQDLARAVPGADTSLPTLVCPDAEFLRCLAYQRGGSPFVCVRASATLREFGVLSHHQNRLQVDLSHPGQYAQDLVAGSAAARFVTPAAPAPRQVCDPAVCSADFCRRDCIDVQYRSEPVTLGSIPVGTLFAITRADGPTCEASLDPACCGAVAAARFSIGTINEEQNCEAEMCREVARIRGVTNSTFTLPWSRSHRIAALHCFRDPVSEGTVNDHRCRSECEFVAPETEFAVPYDLTCVVTGVPACVDDSVAGHVGPESALSVGPGSLRGLVACPGASDWFAVDVCAGGALTASVTSDQRRVALSFTTSAPADPAHPLPDTASATELRFAPGVRTRVLVQASLTAGFQSDYALAIAVAGCEAPTDSGAPPSDATTDVGAVMDAGADVGAVTDGGVDAVAVVDAVAMMDAATAIDAVLPTDRTATTDAVTAIDTVAATDTGTPTDRAVVPDARGEDSGPVVTTCAIRSAPGACTPGATGCDIVDVSISGDSAGGVCVVFTDGSVRCWSNRDRVSVYLGNGTVNGCGTPGLVRDLTQVQSIRHGGGGGVDFRCAVRAGQAMPVWCWGDNSGGQFGASTPFDSRVPIATGIPGGTLSLGGASGFSVSASGVATAWGNNRWGQLGDGTVTESGGVAPHVVSLTGLQQLAVEPRNGWTACGVFTGGEVRCWGAGFAGHFGTAITPITSATRSLTPLTVPGITNAREVRVDGRFACALRTDNTVWCWGLGNDAMILGAGTTPTQVLDHATQVVLGGSVACVLRDDATVWCWGEASLAGNGGTPGDLVPRPTQVAGLSGVRRLYAAFTTLCAWRGGADLRCWGDATGDGTSRQSGVPVAVAW